nr:pentatricopeptide repeat-containing protein At2g22410, mitochondrial-like [Ipomoea batatas]
MKTRETHFSPLHTIDKPPGISASIPFLTRRRPISKSLHGHLPENEQHTDSYAVSDVIRAYALSPHILHKAPFRICDQINANIARLENHMIQGLSQSDRPIDALHMFEEMRKQGSHWLYNKAWVESYLYVSNALISMHASCGELDEAEKLFDEMSNRDLVSWNSLICGYSQCNRYDDVLRLFDAMRAANVEADRVTMVKVVLACSYVGGSETIESVVKYIEANGVEIDVYLGNTLIDMYGKRGLVGLARKTFDNMVERNVVSWNTMIMGYAKAGDLSAARELFDAMPKRDVISWTSMITGYSQANRFCDAIKLFQEMMASGIKPDKITVATVLSAAAHIGTLDVGEAVHNYIHEHGLAVKRGSAFGPFKLLLRDGKKRALSRPMELSFLQYCLLATHARIGWMKGVECCDVENATWGLQTYKNVSLAEIAARKVIELDPANSGKLCFSHHSTYAGAERWEDAMQDEKIDR